MKPISILRSEKRVGETGGNRHRHEASGTAQAEGRQMRQMARRKQRAYRWGRWQGASRGHIGEACGKAQAEGI